MKMKIFFGLFGIVVLSILISGCSDTSDEKVEIKDVKFQSGNLLISLHASQDEKNSKIDILSENGEILCSSYKDLSAGSNQFELSGCDVEKEIKVSVGIPEKFVSVKGFKLDLPEPSVKIKDAGYDFGDLVLTLDSNLEVKNTRIEVISEGNVLCTRYLNLPKGESEQKLSDCGVEEKITISITPPGGALSTKNLDLDVPIFKLKKGYKYDYSSNAYSNQQEISLYITEDSSDTLAGIAGIKRGGQMASILRFKIDKDSLKITATYPLAVGKITSSNVEYRNIKDISRIGEAGTSLLPFWLILIGESEELVGLDLDKLFKDKAITVTQQSSPTNQITLSLTGTQVENGFLVHKIIFSGKEGEEIKNVAELYVSTAKPYHLLKLVIFQGTGELTFKKLEKKDFSLSDYDGYTIEEHTASMSVKTPVKATQEEVQPEQTGNVIRMFWR